MTVSMSDKLVVLYQQMADFTAPECGHTCRVPHSCCDSFACDITKAMAKEVWGVTDLKEYPPNQRGAYYLGESGCTVAPHPRPHCTMHTCSINGLGFKHANGVIDKKWTKDYFKLRNKIELIELTVHPIGESLAQK